MGLPKLSGREYAFLGLTLLQLLACNATYALFAPFFPVVAPAYGVTQGVSLATACSPAAAAADH